MKRKEHPEVGASIFLTIVFAGMAIFTYQSDSWDNFLAWIPGIGVIWGIIMTISGAIAASNRSAREAQQDDFAKKVTFDSSIGDGDLKLYFDSLNKKVTICATTTNGFKQKTISDFVKTQAKETDEYFVVFDATCNKILRVSCRNGSIFSSLCCINEELKILSSDLKPSNPALMTFNKYAFITDDVNKFIAIVTPWTIRVLRYSDIVSISYEENGSNVYNKSLGGAVVGGLLFGGVGAIVGGNTAKATQNKEIKVMSIKILLKSTSESAIILNLFEAGKDGAVLQTKNSGARAHYENLLKEVSAIKDVFSIIIDIVEKDISPQNTPQVIQQTSTMSIADELTKLAKLKEQGLLTEQEFEEQKKKILNT